MNLTHASDTTAVLRVDTTTQNQTTGRRSVRITSKQKYDHGLFIFDVVHAPYGCATWPALWLTDPDNWPDNGEIDVVESHNKGTHGNSMTLHTTKNCKMNAKRKQTGSTQEKDCLYSANNNVGCGVEGPKSSYGEDFNKNGGGVSYPPITARVILTEPGLRDGTSRRRDPHVDVPAQQNPIRHLLELEQPRSLEMGRGRQRLSKHALRHRVALQEPEHCRQH